MSKTTDPSVNSAIDAVAKKFGVSDDAALKMIVARGTQDIAKNMGAKACAAGNNVSFSKPGGGSKTAAHEMTHVIQQSTSKIKQSQ